VFPAFLAREIRPRTGARDDCPVRTSRRNESVGAQPSFGAAYLLPFDIVRIDVARGTGRSGRWFFYIDVSREFWSIL